MCRNDYMLMFHLPFVNRSSRLVLKTVEEDFNKKLANFAFLMRS